jgi:hypothetical protein
MSYVVPSPWKDDGEGLHEPAIVIVCGEPPLTLLKVAAKGWVTGSVSS